jgi:hypothetical protein
MTDFKRVEHLFANFFANTQLLAPSEQREVQGFIDHGEYGLALDTLVAIGHGSATLGDRMECEQVRIV